MRPLECVSRRGGWGLFNAWQAAWAIGRARCRRYLRYMTGYDPKGGANDPDQELRRRREALDARLGIDAPPPARRNAAKSDLARGLKLSSEFIAGIVVGALIGYLFDRFLGTSPFGLIVFLMLGFAAGILNVLRETGAMAKAETRIGERPGDPSMYDDEDD